MRRLHCQLPADVMVKLYHRVAIYSMVILEMDRMSKFAYPRMRIRIRMPAREAPRMRIHMRMPVQERMRIHMRISVRIYPLRGCGREYL